VAFSNISHERGVEVVEQMPHHLTPALWSSSHNRVQVLPDPFRLLCEFHDSHFQFQRPSHRDYGERKWS
jgi:hypothetical protein